MDSDRPELVQLSTLVTEITEQLSQNKVMIAKLQAHIQQLKVHKIIFLLRVFQNQAGLVSLKKVSSGWMTIGVAACLACFARCAKKTRINDLAL